MTNRIQLGTLRVNSTDYDGIVIETFNYANRPEPFWHVPAWEERGVCNLAGPFASEAEAHDALYAHLRDFYFADDGE